MDSSALRVIERFKEAKRESKGLKTRETLRNINIGLNNLAHKDPKGANAAWYAEMQDQADKFIDEITQVLFGVHVPDVKKYITDEVIESLKQAVSIAKTKKDAKGVQYAVYVAADRLRSAVTMLADSPDLDEQKQYLARDLRSLLPDGNYQENTYERALKLSQEIAKGEKGKAKAFFEEHAQGLEAARDGHLELRRAAAFAYKMLPKDR